MNSKNMEVLINIIGAVESGGQVYGKRRYDAYADPYANSSNEVTITLGWAQNYGEEARKLVRMVHDKYPEDFKILDTALIESTLAFNWVDRRYHPTENQKKVLINIINSPAGRICQDLLVQEQLEKYISYCEKDYTNSTAALMMYCEIRHLGGSGPVKRIFDRLNGNYSLDNIMASLIRDQKDTSCDNQVGDYLYWSRHLKCREFIDRYAIQEDKEEEEKKETMAYSRQKVVNLVKSWIGKKESDGTYKSIIDIYNSMPSSMLPRNTKMEYSWPWCACTWSAIAVKLGYTDIMPLEISCYYLIEKAKEMGIWKESDGYIPSPGDAVLYCWSDGSNYASTDCMGTPDHIGTVVSVNSTGGYFDVVEGNMDNAVGKRRVSINGRYIRGFIVPKYTNNTVEVTDYVAELTEEPDSNQDYLPGETTVKLQTFLVGANHVQVKTIQRLLNNLGYKGKDGKSLDVDGSLGENTAYAIECFQRDKGMSDINWGSVAATTWKYLLNS